MKSKSQTSWPDTFKSVSKNTMDFSIHPSIAEKEGILYAAWEDYRTGIPKIFFNDKKAEFWRTPLQVSGQENDTWPTISIDHRNNVHIIYSSSTGNVFHVHRKADTWKTPVILSSGVSPPSAKDFKITKNNLLHAVWRQNSRGSTHIYYCRGTTGGNWLQPIQVASGTNAGFPRLCISDNDKIHIVWTDVGIGGTRDVYYKKTSLPGTKPTVRLIASLSQGIVPSNIHFDASTSTAGSGQILSYWWDFGNGSAMVEGSQTTHNFTTPGVHTVRLFVTNTQLLSSVKSINIDILDGPFPPINIQVASVEEGGLFYKEKINVVTWTENPINTASVTIKYYRIYRKLKTKDSSTFKQIGQVSGALFVYVDRNFVFSQDRYLYNYAVSCIDNQDREGPLGQAQATAMTK
jgi:PKD repeat protein